MGAMHKQLRLLVGVLFILALLPAGSVHGAPSGDIIYVRHDAVGNNYGSSWADAYTDLQDALGVAQQGDEIWVAQGVYYPAPTAIDRAATFELVDGVGLYGGFAGMETERDRRDWEANVTVLSGDLDRNDMTDPYGVVREPANIDGDNAYQVVTSGGVTETAVLDGFTITAGKADSSWPDSRGGEMANTSSSPTLTSWILWGNEASQWPAIFNDDESQPTISYSDIEGSGGSGVDWDDDLGIDDGNAVVDMGAYEFQASPVTHDLSIAVDPEGSGTNDPAVGVHSYAHGTVVDITVTPDEGYEFNHWSGDCTGTDACQVTMSDDKSVTTHFTQDEYTLDVTTAGQGVVDLNPQQDPYFYGDVVTLTLAASPGWSFDSWRGPDARDLSVNKDNSWEVVMDSDESVTATSTQDGYTPDVPIRLVGQIGGGTRAVSVQGTYAYLGVGPRLVVLDIADPADPVFVGQTSVLPGSVIGVAAAGDYAYVAARHSGLRIIDISNPPNPSEVGYCDTMGLAWAVAVEGDHAYVVNGVGLAVVSIANPAYPVMVGLHDTPGTAKDVAVAGGNAYIADSDAGLRVVSVLDPAHLTEVGFYETPGLAESVALANGYVYIADGCKGLRVISVDDPLRPSEVGHCDTPGYARGVAVKGDYAYVANEVGLAVVSITNPVYPVVVGSHDTPGVTEAVTLAGSHAYVVDYHGGLRIVDITDPSNPAEAGSYKATGMVGGDVAIVGSYAYIADGGIYDGQGLHIVDVADPEHPVMIGSYETPGVAEAVAVAGNYAYVADRTFLRIIDITNPADPFEVGFYDCPHWCQNLAVAKGYAYLTHGFLGLRILDVADPADPIEVGFYDTAAQGVEVVGGYAYVAALTGGLRIIDVSDPAHPTELGSYNTPGTRALDVAVTGGYAYFTDMNHGLRILSVVNPAYPSEVGFYPGNGRFVALEGDYAYVFGYLGLQVIHVGDPEHPAQIGHYGHYGTLGPPRGLAVAEDYVYASGAGLFIFQFLGPADFSASLLWAEPSRPTTGHQVALGTQVVNTGMQAQSVVVTSTIPNDTTYVPGSAATSQGTVASEEPLVFNIGPVASGTPVSLRFAVTVNEYVISPTVLRGPLTITWEAGSCSLTHVLIANGVSVYLPTVYRYP